jgi:thioredoxin 1
VKVVKQPAGSPGSNAAKLSIASALVVIGLNMAAITLLKGSAAATMAGVAAMVVVWAGVLAALVGLVKARNCWGRDVTILAVAGLLLNGGLLATGFVNSPIRGRQDAGTENLQDKGFEARPVSAGSRRTVVTKDWTAGSVITLTETSFYDVVNDSDVPVLVDFWAPWCKPCRMMSPAIEEIAGDYEGEVKVCKLNVDNARNISARFNAGRIPTIILFKAGRERKRWVGVTDKRDISMAIDKLLK